MKSIIQVDDDKCHLCHNAFGTDWHHVFQGNPNRGLSEQDGMKVRLCRACHDEVHFGKTKVEKNEQLHKEAQKIWEQTYGTREDFIRRYGKNWLEDEEL